MFRNKPGVTARDVKIEDVDDLIFIELALEASAEFVISGDKHLLDLDEVGSIRILSVAEFLRLDHEKEIVPKTDKLAVNGKDKESKEKGYPHKGLA